MRNKRQRNQENHQNDHSTIQYNDFNNIWSQYQLQKA